MLFFSKKLSKYHIPSSLPLSFNYLFSSFRQKESTSSPPSTCVNYNYIKLSSNCQAEHSKLSTSSLSTLKYKQNSISHLHKRTLSLNSFKNNTENNSSKSHSSKSLTWMYFKTKNPLLITLIQRKVMQTQLIPPVLFLLLCSQKTN